MSAWVMDTEFGWRGGAQTGPAFCPVLCCAVNLVTGQRRSFWGRDPRLKAFIRRHNNDLFVVHDAVAEIGYLLRLGIEPPPRWFDTMIAFRFDRQRQGPASSAAGRWTTGGGAGGAVNGCVSAAGRRAARPSRRASSAAGGMTCGKERDDGMTTTTTTKGRKAAGMFVWRDCWCPRCRKDHHELVAFDTPRTKTPPQVVCDRCFLPRLSPAARQAYQRWKRAVAPPGRAAGARRPARAGFADVRGARRAAAAQGATGTVADILRGAPMNVKRN
jgi:hypothetical protein